MLISVISLPINKPIINSVYDIPRIGGLQIVVNRGMALDAAFAVIKHSNNHVVS